MKTFEFNLSTKIVFGLNSIEKIGDIAKKFGKNTMIVSTPTAAKKSGALDAIDESFKKNGIEYTLFNKIEPNPSIPTVEEGAKLFKETSSQFLVAVGGGSAIDAAKAISVLLSNEKPLREYFGINKVEKRDVPLISVPTTSGTGSEVTKYSVITDPEKRTKNLITSLKICSDVAIVDPVLTKTTPPKITADVGIDALSHLLESYTSYYSEPLSDAIALDGLQKIGKWLPVAYADGTNIEARYNMAYASLLGGIAINNSPTGIAHGMSFPLTARYNIPHGRAVGLLLPYVVEFNLPTNYEKFKKVAGALGEDVSGLPAKIGAELVPSALRELMDVLDFPESLSEMGVSEKDLEKFASDMSANPEKLRNNPRLPTEEDIVQIYRRALEGE